MTLNKTIKRMVAYICAIAMVVTSLTVNNGTIKAEETGKDYSKLEYKASDNDESLSVAFVEGSSEGNITNCVNEGANFYVALTANTVKPDYKEVSCNGNVQSSPRAGANFWIPMEVLDKDAYNIVEIKDAVGGVYHFSIKYGNPTSGIIETTTADSDASTTTVENVDGEVLVNETNVTKEVPAYAGGDYWQDEYNNTPVKYVKGKKYVAEVVVSSTAAKTIKMVFQNTDGWSFIDAGKGYETAIAVGNKIKITYVFDAVQSTDNGNFDIYLGSVADATTLVFESKKLTKYDEVPEGVVTGVEVLATSKPPQEVTALSTANGKLTFKFTAPEDAKDKKYSYDVYLDEKVIKGVYEAGTDHTIDVAPGKHTIKVVSVCNGVKSDGKTSKEVSVTPNLPIKVNVSSSNGRNTFKIEAGEDQKEFKYKVFVGDTARITEGDILLGEEYVANQEYEIKQENLTLKTGEKYVIKVVSVYKDLESKGALEQEIYIKPFDPAEVTVSSKENGKVTFKFTAPEDAKDNKYSYEVYLDGKIIEGTYTADKEYIIDAEVGEHIVKVRSVLNKIKSDGKESEKVSVPRYKFTITYNYNGGKGTVKKATVEKGKTYGTLPKAQRRKYKFLGWYTAPKGGEKVTAKKTRFTLNTDHILYAQWEKIVVPLHIDYSRIKQRKGKISLTVRRAKQVSGFVIYCSYNAKFKKAVKIDVKGKKKATFVVKKVLKKAKVGWPYYYRIRPYIIDSANKKVWGKKGRVYMKTYRKK